MTQLLTPQQLHDYQREAILHQLHHKDSMLWLGMGLGKTICTLTTIVDRMRAGQIQKTLIFGPLRVIQSVWSKEASKWSHTKHLRFSVLHGAKDVRTRALFADADVYLCNYEAMNWLAETLDHYYLSQDRPLPFQFVVYDEVSMLKNSTSKRVAGGKRVKKDGWGQEYEVKLTGWRKLIPEFEFRTGLTGTPASNGYLDLHGQYLAVDGGKRLGEYVTRFKDSYFTSDYNGWKYTPTEEGKRWIEYHISDITKKMDAKDYLDLPAVSTTNLLVDLPPAARKAYQEVEDDMFTCLDNGREIELFSRSSVSNKCLQFCLAEGTEVLTRSGWKPIEQFQEGDQVWDGVEWVNVYSLAFQGYKKVVELDGVWMTPDHKVLTVSGWKEAREVLNSESSKRFDREKVRLPDGFETTGFDCDKEQKGNLVGALCLWQRVCDHWSKFNEPEQTGGKVMRVPPQGIDTQCDRFSRYDEDSAVYCMGQHEVALSQPEGQRLPQLRRSWDRGLRRMVQLVCSFLGRYEERLSRPPLHRASEQQRSLHQGELSLGYTESAIEQSKNIPPYQYPVREDDSDSSCSKIRVQRCDTIRQNTQRLVGRPIAITSKIEKTYDLINAGERNRFTVRGKGGQVFIAHNCNGTPYVGDTSDWEKLHDAKLNALGEILEEANGQPVLCSYSFVSDAQRIMQKFKKYRPVNLTAEPSSRTGQIIDDWNAGKIKLIIGHPKSMGHGIDGLQKSGCILVWFGINWSLELYDQMNARLDRQGQKSPVSIIRILCRDTLDLAVADAIERKTDTQEGLKSAISRYRKGITTNDLSVNFF